MTQDFLLLHRSGPDRFHLDAGFGHGLSADPDSRADAGESFSFMTCLRHIVISDQAAKMHVEQGGDLLRGEEAYRFLLEVICGLHSPLIGETEVAGQFKNAVGAFSYPLTPWGSQLAKTFKILFEDAKKVRDAHLKDLGSQSYGSVLRREIRGSKSVHILGSGHLVQEILPWVMKDGLSLTIHARDVAKACRQLTEKLGASVVSRLSIVPLVSSLVSPLVSPLGPADSIVIAAPVSSAFVREWAGSSGVRFVADLRADSAVDQLSGDWLTSTARRLDLGAFMSRLSENQAQLLQRKSLALVEIAKAATERSRTVEYRPFGWGRRLRVSQRS